MDGNSVAISVVKGNLKKAIEDSFKAFMSNYFNRGPGLAKVYIINNCITIYCKDILTVMEKNLLEDRDSEKLIKISRHKIIRNNETEFINIINNNNLTLDSYYIDFNIMKNSLVCVFIIHDC